MNVLLTSAGRRVALVRAFRAALDRAGGGRILAADLSITAPSLVEADGAALLPPVTSPEYVDALCRECLRNEVGLVVPLIDPELPILAREKPTLAARGIVVAVSSPEAVHIAQDKMATYGFFSRLGLQTPFTCEAAAGLQMVSEGLISYPLVVKPRQGSASTGVVVCRDDVELGFYTRQAPDLVVQQMLSGVEVTIDVFGNGEGAADIVVPRQRLKVRGGEVERGITIDNAEFVEHVSLICKALRPYGPVNVQCFVTNQGIYYTEINARFGGGYPLSHAAGACFPERLLDLVQGRSSNPGFASDYQRGLLMMRFDDAFYIDTTDKAEYSCLSCQTAARPSRSQQ